MVFNTSLRFYLYLHSFKQLLYTNLPAPVMSNSSAYQSISGFLMLNYRVEIYASVRQQAMSSLRVLISKYSTFLTVCVSS